MRRGWKDWPVLLAALAPLALAAASGGVNSPDRLGASTVVLVSLDGFGRDFRSMTDTPALDRLAAGGVRAAALRPVYPTLTFPNHYSIATGLYPVEHGIVANNFPAADRSRWYRMRERETVQDGSWYGGEPIWVTAERHGLVSAAFFFVGTEAPVAGVSPTYWRPFDAGIPGEARVDQVLDWLALPERRRPHLVTLYFEDVDVAAHEHGPGSAETLAAIRRVDAYLGRLIDGLERLDVPGGIHVIVVSDHGQMAPLDGAEPFVLAEHVEIGGLTIIEGGSYLNLFLEVSSAQSAVAIRDTVNAAWESGRAYLRDDAPARWRFGSDGRFPDIVLMADPGHTVVSTPARIAAIKRGKHGWDPATPSMHGIFIASGQLLPAGREIGEISVVDVFPLMLAILGLPDPRPPCEAAGCGSDPLTGLVLR